MNRRQFLALGGTVGFGGLAGCTFSRGTESSTSEGMRVGLESVVEGVTFPTAVAFLPGGDLLVAERGGRVRRATDDGLAAEPFLALGDRLDGTDGEKGLLGLELHPDFADTRRLYVRYSGAPPADGGFSHSEVLSEFVVTPDLTGVVPGSERRILAVPQPGPLHNAGDLAFGPEGYLYVAFGDGQRTDTGVDDELWWYEQGRAAQDTRGNLLGSVLRIDVDERTGDRPYGIPSDNPLVGREGRDEYYAWGLRNPYRISVDGDRLFIGDVGEHIREAVYLGEAGANYGWPMFEGSNCGAGVSLGHTLRENPLNVFNPKTWLAQTNRISPVTVCPGTDETEGPIRPPVVEYHRAGSRAVTGGYVYRGDGLPELSGAYLFGDYIPPAPLFAVEEPEADERPWPMTELAVAGTETGRLADRLLSFARDPEGEVYVITTGGRPETGRVRRLTRPG